MAAVVDPTGDLVRPSPPGPSQTATAVADREGYWFTKMTFPVAYPGVWLAESRCRGTSTSLAFSIPPDARMALNVDGDVVVGKPSP